MHSDPVCTVSLAVLFARCLFAGLRTQTGRSMLQERLPGATGDVRQSVKAIRTASGMTASRTGSRGGQGRPSIMRDLKSGLHVEDPLND